MDNLITDAYPGLTVADIALSHGWRYGAPIPPGIEALREYFRRHSPIETELPHAKFVAV